MGTALQVVTFRLGREQFGVPIGAIHEVVRPPEITPVPEALPCVEGVINLRGRILPVFDLGRRFRLPERPRSRATRILVAEAGGRAVGLVVDAVCEVVRLPEAAVEPPPPMVSAVGVDYISGVGRLRDQLLILLDLERVLDPADLQRPDAASDRVEPARPDTAAASPTA